MLSEFPELCGVEHSLRDRCVTVALADKLVGLMRAYYASAQICSSGFDAHLPTTLKAPPRSLAAAAT